MIFRRIFVWLFLLTLIPLSGKADHPPPSPAGGGMLSLDETHDFVATANAWFPDKEFEGLTAEAWIYFETPPEHGTFWSIIGQEGRFNLALHGNGQKLGAWVYADGAGTSAIFGGALVPEREWVHVTAIYDAGAGKGVNGIGGNVCCPIGVNLVIFRCVLESFKGCIFSTAFLESVCILKCAFYVFQGFNDGLC